MEFVDLDPRTAFDEAISTANDKTKLVVCGSRSDIDSIEDNLEIEFSIDEIIDSSKEVVFPGWFADKKAEYDSEWEMDVSENEGEWPGEITEKQGFTLCRDVLSGDLVKDDVVKLPQINCTLFLSPFLLGVYRFGFKVESSLVGELKCTH